MLETIDQWITAIASWMAIIPVQGWAILAGLFIGSVSTQWLKRTFPVGILFPNLKEVHQKMYIRISALLFSFLPTYYIWPDDRYRLWAAIAIGFGTPTVYRVGSFFVYKKWPDLRTRFSGIGNGS